MVHVWCAVVERPKAKQPWQQCIAPNHNLQSRHTSRKTRLSNFVARARPKTIFGGANAPLGGAGVRYVPIGSRPAASGAALITPGAGVGDAFRGGLQGAKAYTSGVVTTSVWGFSTT